MSKALFLDRDGIINIEKNYVYRVEDFEFTQGIFEVCRYYKKQGYLIFVITNQAGIARGYYTEADFATLTVWMVNQFKERGIEITKVYHCPHHPDFTGECACRKPNPGMILQAQKEFNLNLPQSILIGDKQSDIDAGKNAGVGENILVKDHQLANLLHCG